MTPQTIGSGMTRQLTTDLIIDLHVFFFFLITGPSILKKKDSVTPKEPTQIQMLFSHYHQEMKALCLWSTDSFQNTKMRSTVTKIIIQSAPSQYKIFIDADYLANLLHHTLHH